MGFYTLFSVVIALFFAGSTRAQQSTCGALNFHGETCTNADQCCSDLCRWANAAQTHKECFCREENRRCTVNNHCCSYECGANGRCTAPSPSGPVPSNPPSTPSPVADPTVPPSTPSPVADPTVPPSTSAPTNAPPSGTCAGDLHPLCPGWLQYCTDPVFIDFMTENCCGTCGAPTPAPTPAPVDGQSCSDSSTWATFCPQWATDGHCGGGQFLGFMQIECRQTCQFCTGGTSPPAAPPTATPTTAPPTTAPPTTTPPASSGCPTGCRVRRSFTSMTNAEKNAYTSAFVTLASGGAGNALRNQFRQLIDLHEIEWANGIHSMQQFLPWHRWYLLELESLLQQVDCTVTIPYWSWESEPFGQAFNSDFWAPNGFGGGSGGQCVQDGPFRQGQYSQTPRAQTTGASACIRRSRAGAMPTFSQVNSLYGISASNFANFNGGLDSLHGTVHCSIGGSMCESFTNSFGQTIFTAANAPEFFLHHTNVDKIWDTWQRQSNNHLNSFSGSLDASMASTGGVTPRMVRDSSSFLGTCVQYAPHVTRRDVAGSGHVDHQHDGLAHPPIVDNVTDVCIPDGFLQSLERWYMLKNLSLSERQERVAEFTAIMCSPPETLLEATGRNISHGRCSAPTEGLEQQSEGDAHAFVKYQLFAVVTGFVGVVLGAVLSWLFTTRSRADPVAPAKTTTCTITEC